jgi:2,3-bisphosphoglycerate-independent phosphoglycerate mutase
MLINYFATLKKTNNALHLMGLLSDAGVHSHQENLYALLKFAHMKGLKNVFIHAFLDGRDTPPKSAIQFLSKLEKTCNRLHCGIIASLHGRFYAMDRDNNWERTKKSYNVLCGNTTVNTKSWKELLQNSYTQNITDEFFKPILINQLGTIKKEDGIICFNFRPDRAQQITRPFIDPTFNKFKTKNLNSTKKTLAFFVSTTRYKKEFQHFNNDILFEQENITHTLLDEISQQTNGKKLFIIAETEKYAHVTYFFRGMNETKFDNAQYTLIPSIKTKSYDHYPEMSAKQITDAILKSLQMNPAYFYLVNYANPDMVGHSGNLNATIKACEFLDIQLEKLYKEVVEKQNGTIFITGDHGNAEEMINPTTGEPKTAHSQNPVIFITLNKDLQHSKAKTPQYPNKPSFGLSIVAPTILRYLGLKIPSEMS